MKKRIVSMLLVVLMLFTMIPTAAFAATSGETGVFAAKFGKSQVFDCFRDPVAGGLEVYGFTEPYIAPYENGVKVNWELPLTATFRWSKQVQTEHMT